jgi:transcriptional regulator with XRE-family HTH domain
MRSYRTHRGLSIEEVAKQAGMTEYAIKQLECGGSPGNASIEDLEKIAAALSCGVTVIDLKVWRGRMTINTVFSKGGRFRLSAIPLSSKKTE